MVPGYGKSMGSRPLRWWEVPAMLLFFAVVSALAFGWLL